MVPGGDYDDCSFYAIIDEDPESKTFGEDLEEPEEMAFISDFVHNAKDYLNQKGVAVLEPWGITIEIMYDDMVNPDNPGADTLFSKVDAEGNKQLFVEPFDGAGASALSVAAAASAMALYLLN